MTDPGTGFFTLAAVPIALVAWVYERGIRRRRETALPVNALRQTLFWSGIVALLLSLEWPFESWAHHLFFVHQIGFMIARIIAPILIATSHPAGTLIAGIPRRARVGFLKPGLLSPAIRSLWRVLRLPTLAVLIYVGALYTWEVPALQTAALAHPPLGYGMHLSLFLSGLLFWSRIFERRPAPHGVTHGARLMMIWLAILAQILLGAYVTVKTTILYPAYGSAFHLGLMTPIGDEETGGFFIWIPSGLLSLGGLIGVIHQWGRHETRQDEKRRRWTPSNSAILLYPTTAAALREMTREKNRRLAILLTGFVLLVFGAMLGVVSGAHRVNRRENMRLYILSRS